MLLEFFFHLIRNGLILTDIGSTANDKEVGKRRDSTQIQNNNIVCFFGFGGTNGCEPDGLFSA